MIAVNIYKIVFLRTQYIDHKQSQVQFPSIHSTISQTIQGILLPVDLAFTCFLNKSTGLINVIIVDKNKNKVMALQDYTILAKIGHGKYSSVYKIKRKSDSALFALKKVQMAKLQQKGKSNALSQQKLLKELDHPNIITLIESHYDEESESLYLILQLSHDGDLQMKIKESKLQNLRLQEEQIWNIISQVSNGLSYLHSKNIMHRDIKPSNILRFQNGNYKITDMNISKVCEYMNYTRTGTLAYACPEIWKGESYDIKSDIWSFGCMIYELMCLKRPFFSEDLNEMYKKVTKCYFINISDNYSMNLKNLVSSMMQLNPKMRPSSLYIYKTTLNHVHKITSELLIKRLETITPPLINSKSKVYKMQELPKEKMISLIKKSKSHNYESQKSSLFSRRYNILKTRLLETIDKSKEYDLDSTLRTQEDLQPGQNGFCKKFRSKIVRNRVLKISAQRKKNIQTTAK